MGRLEQVLGSDSHGKASCILQRRGWSCPKLPAQNVVAGLSFCLVEKQGIFSLAMRRKAMRHLTQNGMFGRIQARCLIAGRVAPICYGCVLNAVPRLRRFACYLWFALACHCHCLASRVQGLNFPDPATNWQQRYCRRFLGIFRASSGEPPRRHRSSDALTVRDDRHCCEWFL